VVFAHGVLHHIPKIQRAQQEIHRVVSRHGELVVMLYARWSLTRRCTTSTGCTPTFPASKSWDIGRHSCTLLPFPSTGFRVGTESDGTFGSECVHAEVWFGDGNDQTDFRTAIRPCASRVRQPARRTATTGHHRILSKTHDPNLRSKCQNFLIIPTPCSCPGS
jgi:hypothetical protein